MNNHVNNPHTRTPDLPQKYFWNVYAQDNKMEFAD